MSVRATADRVIEATGELRELRSRLTELDAERASVEKRIQNLLAEIGVATRPDVPTASETPRRHWRREPVITSEKILATLEENPDTAFNTLDIAKRWNDISGIDAFRASLSRLTAQGKIRRIRHGWYSAITSKR